MAEEEKKATMCEVIKYLDESNEELYADFSSAACFGCNIDDDNNEILGITYGYTENGPRTSATFDTYSVNVLGWDFSTNEYFSYDFDEAECWMIPREMEVGNTDTVKDILEDFDIEPDENGKFSRENVEEALRKQLYDKIICEPEEVELTVDRVLTGITREFHSFYVLKSEGDNPTRIFVGNDLDPDAGEDAEEDEERNDEEIKALFVEIDDDRAAQILYDKNIDLEPIY